MFATLLDENQTIELIGKIATALAPELPQTSEQARYKTG